jgi:hypothetical protein
MNTLENIVLGAVDTCTTLLCRRAPGQEDNTVCALLTDKINDLLCELFPALTGMRVSLMGAHSETCVQQQDTTVSPRCEQASFVRRRLERWIFLLQCFVDILEGWRSRSRGSDGEAKTVSLIIVMIWILAEDDSLDGIKWCVSRPGESVNGTGAMLRNTLIRHTNCRHLLMEGKSSCQPRLQSLGTSSGQGRTWK